MHERSVTVGTMRPPNRREVAPYYNLNGITGQPLPPRFPFEQASYPAMQQALAAAVRRSATEGRYFPEEYSAATQVEAGRMNDLLRQQQALAAAVRKR